MKKKWAGKVQAAYIRAFTNKRENFAAIMLARWARMYAADTKDHQLRELVLLNLEDQILSAAERKDGRFFRVFAKHLEQEKHPCSIRLWVWDKHLPGPNDKGIPTFKRDQLIAEAKASGLFNGVKDATIEKRLRRIVKEFGYRWTNSP